MFQLNANNKPEPLLVAAGGGGASDLYGASNNPDARGLLYPTATMQDLLRLVQFQDNDAGGPYERAFDLPQVQLVAWRNPYAFTQWDIPGLDLLFCPVL